MAEKQKRGLSSSLVAYMNNNQGKLITIQDLMLLFPDWDRNQILQAMTNLLNPKEGRPTLVGLEKLQTGVWRFVDGKKAAKDNGRQTLTLEIIRETDEVTIAVDDSGNIYKLILVA